MLHFLQGRASLEKNSIHEDHANPEHGAALRIQLTQLFWMLGPAFIRWAESLMEKDGLTPKRMYLMGVLFEHGPMMMSSLKDRLGVTATNVTALVDALENEGLVERKAHPEDRRATIIALSAKSEECLVSKCAPFMDRVSELFSIFSEKEQQELLSSLLRIRTVLVEHKILDEKSRSFDHTDQKTGD